MGWWSGASGMELAEFRCTLTSHWGSGGLPLKKVALHEAAHVVTSIRFGGRIKSVEIHDGWGHTQMWMPRGLDMVDGAVTCVAGHVAEWLDNAFFRPSQLPSTSDYEHAAQCLEGTGVTMEEVEARARKLLGWTSDLRSTARRLLAQAQ